MRNTTYSTRWVRTLALSLSILAAAPVHAQRGEVYALGGYSRTLPFHDSLNGDSWAGGNWGLYGGGAGVRLVSILGLAGEVAQERGPGGWGPGDTRYTGFSLNAKVETRGGRFRPYALAGVGGGSLGVHSTIKNRFGIDVPGASNSTSAVWIVQFGGGVAVQLSRHLFLRPQIRYQNRHELSFMGSSNRKLPSPVSLCIALGYRF
jgi:opacity protein-like surface antigen